MASDARRSEILFCYDVRMANPNGDPDENRPRIDIHTRKNLVTDFRLKRTIRDYLMTHAEELGLKGQKIFIRQEWTNEGHLKEIEDLAEPYIGKEKKLVERDKLIKEHIDIRLFGILFAVGEMPFKQVGPVQFSIGQSLHPVEEIPLRITRVVPTREKVKAGTMGEKSILRYSFIVFRGFVNDVVANETKLTENEVNAMLKAMWFGTTELSTTSKYGQQSRLLLRLCYKEPHAYVGDLDRHISLDLEKIGIEPSKLEDISQLVLNVDDLFDLLGRNIKKIGEIQYASHDELKCSWKGVIKKFSDHMNEWYEAIAKPEGIVLTDLLG